MDNAVLSAKRSCVASAVLSILSGSPRATLPVISRLVLALYMALAVTSVTPTEAQVRIGPNGVRVEGDESTDNVFFPVDRDTMQRLNKAQELLRDKHYGDASRLLDKILEESEDYFFQPQKDQPIYRSLKAEAQRLIGSMPTEGRESYELQYGASAQRLLEQAIEGGDVNLLAEVSRRFFHTKAGYDATFILGSSHMDHGLSLAAALCFKRLQDNAVEVERFEPDLSMKMATCWYRAGMQDKAIETLSKAKQRYSDQRVEAAGRAQPWFAKDAAAVNWLADFVGPPPPDHTPGAEQWGMFRGNAGRNAPSLGSSPLLDRRWDIPTSDRFPDIQEMLSKLREAYLDQGLTVVPSLHPLAVRDDVAGPNGTAGHEWVFMRSIAGLIGIDFRTGKRICQGTVHESVLDVLDSDKGKNSALKKTPLFTNWLDQRMWEDTTYGTMSSDGVSVFCVEDQGISFAPNFSQRTIVMANGRQVPQVGQPGTNRLAAYNIAGELKLTWDIGSQYGQDPPELAGAFFLGPPLPLVGRLYVLAEIKQEIRLIALNAKNGALEWSQQLVRLDSTAGKATSQRSGVSPSYADGVLVCPTSAGAVVAVDLTTRSLLWGYQYPHVHEGNANQMFVVRMGNTGNNDGHSDRWTDSSVTIEDGRVLLTPPESKQLHCLSLFDGKLQWSKPRGDGLYLACVDKGKVIVVEKGGVRAYKLAGGEQAWSQPTAPLSTGGTPSGRGFYNNNRYYLPLSSAEVATIDLNAGRVIARAKSRSGRIPGNLICFQGSVVSQGVDYVECFYQLDDLREQVATALTKNPRDAEALARNGQLLLDEGKLGQAVVHLRKSFEEAPEPRTRELLVDALLEGLRLDFAAHRDNVGEIERLIDQPEQRTAYLRLLAAGLHEAGQTLPAFETYLKLVKAVTAPEELERVERGLSVRRDRWVQARMVSLRENATPEQLAEMDKVLRTRLDEAQAAKGVEGLHAFLNFFGNHPIADEAREALAVRIQASGGSLLETEQLLRRLERSSKAELSRAATCRLALMLQQAARPDEAEPFLRRMAGEWGDVVCIDGKTGRQLIEQLPVESEARRQLTRSDTWPVGQVEKSDVKGLPGSSFRNFGVEMRGPTGPFFNRTTVEFDQQQQYSLVGRDGVGRERWRVGLNDPNDRNSFFYNPMLSHARADGHLLLVTVGFQLAAVDTLGQPGKDRSGGIKVLWRQDLTENLPGMQRNQGFGNRIVQMPWGGGQRLIATDSRGRPIGSVGLATSELVCFQRMRNLLAVHPLTGKPLWTRFDTKPGSDIFGDDELLFVTEPGSKDAVVLRTLDGTEIGRRPVPPVEQRMLNLGRNVLTWQSVNGKITVKYTDVWKEKEIWSRQFEGTAKAWPLNHEALGVLDRKGHFVLINIADGTPTIDEMLEPDAQMHEIYMLRTPTRDLLIASRPHQPKNGQVVQALPSVYGTPVIDGYVHGFDRQSDKPTKRIFSTRIEMQGLSLTQPRDLPVLVFGSQIYNANNNNGRTNEIKSSLLCMDKRNGRIVHDEKKKSPMSMFEINGDPERNEVLIKSNSTALKLTFTDKPYPPEEKVPPKSDENNKAGDGKKDPDKK